MPELAFTPAARGARLLRETVYGSRKRLEWIMRHATRDDAILEVGCGTGYMLCRPLAKLGYRVQGIDLDAKSIERGQQLLRAEGLDPGILAASPLSAVRSQPDVIIASEVLEHLHDDELDALLHQIQARLGRNGRLLATVPNGYGWFEAEQFVWGRLHVGDLVFPSGLGYLVESTKARFLGREAVDPGPPSTLSASPHVQRFTMSSITRRLAASGFEIVDVRGSVAFSGPFSNLLFAGVERVLEANARWGDRLGRLASGFFVACRVR